MRMAFRAFAHLVLLISVSATSAVGQSAEYRDTLDQYRAGHFDAAVSTLLKLDGERVLREGDELIEANAKPFRREVFQAALVMHSQATMTLVAEFASGGPTLQQMRRIGPRSRAEGHAIVKTKLENLLRNTAPRNDEFLLHLTLLRVSASQGIGVAAGARYIAENALERERAHPEMQLAIGAIHETAWQRLHDRTTKSEGFTPSLRDAEEAYRRALAGGSAREEAFVRLARVLALGGNVEGALETLKVSPPLTEPGFIYLAKLFEGDALERQGDLNDAAACYEAAIRTLPEAQSARLALAHLRHLAGNRQDAAERVKQMVTDAVALDTADPWFWYTRGTYWRAEPYLALLQAMIRR
jgi:tetratricopeptide (TPR) repeat protein